MKKAAKILRNVFIGLLGLIVLLLVTLQIVLSPKVLTKLLNEATTSVINGTVSFREVRAHVLTSFPYLNLDVSDCSITYPHTHFDRFDSLVVNNGRRFNLLQAGYGDGVDTLASFRKLSVSLNYMSFLNAKEIYIHSLEVDRPRMFAHYFDTTAANWDILPIDPARDTLIKEKMPMPAFRLNTVSLTGRPFIVATDLADSLQGLFTLHRLSLDGVLETSHPDRANARFRIDSLLVAALTPRDTVSLGLRQLQIQAAHKRAQVDMDANARIRSRSLGRLDVPVHMDTDASLTLHGDRQGADFHSLHLNVSTLKLDGGGSVFKRTDGSLDMQLQASLRDGPIGEVMEEYQYNFPFLRKIKTNACLNVDAKIDGTWGNGKTPRIEGRVLIPAADLEYEDLSRKGRIAVDITGTTDRNNSIQADIDRLYLDFIGVKADIRGGVKDILGPDPVFNLNGTVHARVDTLTRLFTDKMGISGTGQLDGQLKGRARKSQLNRTHIAETDLAGDFSFRDLSLRMKEEGVRARIPTIDIRLATEANKQDRKLPEGARVLSLSARADTMGVTVPDLSIRGNGLQVNLHHSADILTGGDNRLAFMGKMDMKRIRLRQADNLITLRDVGLGLSAARHPVRSRGGQTRRDSLLRRPAAPTGGSDGSDISIRIGDTPRGYVRDWDADCDLSIASARLRTPAFPLRTTLSDLSLHASNDTLHLKNCTVRCGASDVTAKAQLTGIRRMLLGRRNNLLKLNADVHSHFIDAGELMRGLAYYTIYEHTAEGEKISDDELEKREMTLPDNIEIPQDRLLMVPSNLNATVSMEADGIRYDSLQVYWAAADLAVRDRTAQITNALAASNMGDLFFEGFYATRSKQDLKAGFDLNLVDISAQQVITLFPAVDSLMPMLTCFSGDLNCEMAATAEMDTLMVPMLPTINGIMRISGTDLTIANSAAFSKLAHTLRFKDPNRATVDNMTVTGTIRDNVLEIYPFVIGVDRYLLAASGTQNLPQEFNYHVSVIKSPLLVKLGFNAWGPDFQHPHFGLARPKYRSVNVPVYTKELDEMQYSIVASIHNVFDMGVDRAMEENRTQRRLPSLRQADRMDAEGLSEDHMDKMQALANDVLEHTSAREEALKQEILRLQEEASHAHE